MGRSNVTNKGFKVKNASVSDIHRGMVACAPSNSLKPVFRFTAQIIIMNHPGEIHPGYAPYCYCHTDTFAVKFVEIVQKLDKRTGKVVEEKPKSIKAGESGLVVMEPHRLVCVETFQNVPPLGRFVIRDNNLTVAVGIIKSIEYHVPNIKGGKPVNNQKSKYFR